MMVYALSVGTALGLEERDLSVSYSISVYIVGSY
jgi:hypothetical protein